MTLPLFVRPLVERLARQAGLCAKTLGQCGRVAPKGRIGRARVGLVTIIEEEFTAAQEVFGLHQEVPETGYFMRQGIQGEWDVVLLQASDRSNVPVAGDVTKMMEDLRPQVLLLVGIAGGLCDGKVGRDGIKPGDVVLVDQVTYAEFLKLDPEATAKARTYAMDQPSLPLRRNVSIPLSKTFRIRDALTPEHQPPLADAPCKIHIGSLVSAEKVMADPKSQVQEELLKPYPKALALDMESVGMARAVCDGRSSFWYHPRYAVVRGISDLVAADENNLQRSQWKAFASHAAAIVAHEFVRRLPSDHGGPL